MLRLLLVLCLGLGSQAVQAQDDSLQDISVQEWREIALGHTLTYKVGDTFFAIERYARTGNQVELQFSDGTCYSGTWSHAGNLFCFDYGQDRPHCFRHVRAGSDVLIIGYLDGVETGDIQVMSGVSDAPLSCGLQMS